MTAQDDFSEVELSSYVSASNAKARVVEFVPKIFKNREMIADFAPIPMGDINEANKFLSAEISRLMQENSSLKMKIERVHKWAGDHSAKMSIAIDAARNLAGCPISAKTFSDRKSVCDEVIEIINI